MLTAMDLIRHGSEGPAISQSKYVTAMSLIRHGSEGPAISQECVSPTDEDQFNIGVVKQRYV